MTKFANVDVPLDDLITRTRKTKSSIGKRSGGFSSSRGRDFNSHWRGGLRKGGDRGGYVDHDAPEQLPRLGGGNKTVRVNISNLAPSVVSNDLEELFGDYGLDTAVVNYNEHGESLGTGDIVLKKRDAEKLIKQFSGVALDQHVLKFALVDESQGIASRLDFGAKRLLQPSRFKRPSRGRGDGLKRSEDFLRSGVHEGIIGSRKAGGKKFNEKKSKKSEAELDAELEAYMSKRKA
ncbi:unnamed protein product [Caenorhabditis auriculariae]|uniref:Chromatin target of PRMT1 protein C-terminal domain-containing protein n=1 Tax=Caenorhabditis auriculariae TaxID=2777116 RepID=A0A8S1HD81_9PELO|nr:unnamed protein product [Caenorhabditis auriculariae]